MKNKNWRTPPFNAFSHEPEVLRTVIFEHEYEASRAQICGGIRQADDFLQGLERFISKRAEMGYAYKPNDPPGVATYLSKILPSGKRIRVLYWYNREVVKMVLAWEVPGS